MITKIEIHGFKSYVSQHLDVLPLTVLTGLNSSGKSSVIQAIRILERVANKEKNPLLEGHGSIDELKNSYSKDGIHIAASFSCKDCIDDAKFNGEIIYSSEKLDCDYSVGFPEVIYIAADRFGPQTAINISSNHKLGAKGENVLNCIEKYQYEELSEIIKHEKSEGESFQYNLEAWLGAISPGIKFRYEIQKLSDSSYSLFNEHRAMNVGFGLSYTLPIIVALFMGTIVKNSIVLLENPEAHLHPRGQTELAKLIALSVKAGAQVIVETHSDHLFDGIRVFSKINKGFAKNVSTYWFELDEQKNTKVERAILDDNGRIDNWPKGMFDQFEINASELL